MVAPIAVLDLARDNSKYVNAPVLSLLRARFKLLRDTQTQHV